MKAEGCPTTHWEFIQAPRVPGAARQQVLAATRSFGLNAWAAEARQGALGLPVPAKAGCEGAGEASRAGAEADAGTGPGRDRDSATPTVPLPGAAPQRPPEAAHAPRRPRAALWATGGSLRHNPL